MTLEDANEFWESYDLLTLFLTVLVLAGKIKLADLWNLRLLFVFLRDIAARLRKIWKGSPQLTEDTPKAERPGCSFNALSIHNRYQIEKIGNDSWKVSNGGFMFQELEPNYVSDGVFKMEVENKHRNFWIDVGNSGRKFEMLHHKGEPIISEAVQRIQKVSRSSGRNSRLESRGAEVGAVGPEPEGRDQPTQTDDRLFPSRRLNPRPMHSQRKPEPMLLAPPTYNDCIPPIKRPILQLDKKIAVMKEDGDRKFSRLSPPFPVSDSGYSETEHREDPYELECLAAPRTPARSVDTVKSDQQTPFVVRPPPLFADDDSTGADSDDERSLDARPKTSKEWCDEDPQGTDSVALTLTSSCLRGASVEQLPTSHTDYLFRVGSESRGPVSHQRAENQDAKTSETSPRRDDGRQHRRIKRKNRRDIGQLKPSALQLLGRLGLYVVHEPPTGSRKKDGKERRVAAKLASVFGGRRSDQDQEEDETPSGDTSTDRQKDADQMTGIPCSEAPLRKTPAATTKVKLMAASYDQRARRTSFGHAMETKRSADVDLGQSSEDNSSHLLTGDHYDCKADGVKSQPDSFDPQEFGAQIQMTCSTPTSNRIHEEPFIVDQQELGTRPKTQASEQDKETEPRVTDPQIWSGMSQQEEDDDPQGAAAMNSDPETMDSVDSSRNECSDDSGLNFSDMQSTEEDHDDELDTEIPEALINEINRVCRETQLNHWEMKQLDPANKRKIFLFARGVTSHQTKISSIAEKFEGFRIITREMEEADGIPLGIFKPLVGGKKRSVSNHPRLPFRFVTWEMLTPECKKPTKYSTCELIVRGEDLLRAGDAVSDTEYWAVISAHHVLSNEQCVRLINADPEEHNKIWNEICSPTWNITYSLEDHQGRRIDVVGQPLFRYWHYAPRKYQRTGENNTTDKFLNDVLLFKLDSDQLEKYGWLKEDADTNLCKLEVHTGRFSLGHDKYRYHEARVKGIAPIRTPADFGRFHGKKRLRVLVNNNVGKLENPDVRHKDAQFLNTWAYGLHFQFILEDGEKMVEGDSGSIVYAIDKNDKKLYALGMLIGIYRDDEISGGSVYQATALWPCLKQIEDHMNHRIKDIQIVGIDQVSNKESKNVIPDMVSLDSGIYEK